MLNLPLHLRTVHKFSHAASVAAVSQYGQRKATKTNLKKSYHHKRLCPFDGCRKVLVHLGPHLEKVHGIEKGTPDYIKYLRSASRFHTTKMPMHVQKSPDKQISVISKPPLFNKHPSTTPHTSNTSIEYVPHHGLEFLNASSSEGDEESESSLSEDDEDNLKVNSDHIYMSDGEVDAGNNENSERKQPSTIKFDRSRPRKGQIVDCWKCERRKT